MKNALLPLAAALLAFSAALGQYSQAQSPQPRHIIGGQDVTSDEFSFVAKIVYGGSQVGCTGSLIAENKVLTAAHCFRGYEAGSISVAFGNQRNVGDRYQATSIERHPLYSGSPKHDNDFAIVEFSPAVQNIKPIRILKEEAELQWVSEVAYGVVAGWGGTTAVNDPPLPGILQETAVPIYREEQCGDLLRKLRREGKSPQNPEISYKVLCAGEEGQAAGQGDSGGPLLVLTPDGWAQVGVLSQSTRNPYRSTPRIVYFNTFFRTALVYDWIHPRPDAYRLYFAHSASGGGWQTDLLLLNTTKADAEVTIKAIGSYDIIASALSLTEWRRPVSLDWPNHVSTSEVVVTSNEELVGFLRIRHTSGLIAAVSSTPLAPKFMLPVSAKAERLGFAVYNPHPSQRATVRIELQNCSSVYWQMGPENNRATFLDEILYFEGCDIEGVLIIEETTGLEITVLALEVTGNNLVTLPVAVLKQ